MISLAGSGVVRASTVHGSLGAEEVLPRWRETGQLLEEGLIPSISSPEIWAPTSNHVLALLSPDDPDSHDFPGRNPALGFSLARPSRLGSAFLRSLGLHCPGFMGCAYGSSWRVSADQEESMKSFASVVGEMERSKSAREFSLAGYAKISVEAEIEAGISRSQATSKWLEWLLNARKNP